MTTLIIGCGYLGGRVGHLLRKRGEAVLGTVRSTERAVILAGQGGVTPIVADVLDPRSLDALPRTDRVLYCLGFDRSSGASRRAVVVDGLRSILERLGDGVERFVFASTTGVYAQDDGGWVDERSPTEPRHESGRIALEAEQVVRAFADRCPSVAILRYAGLYGPGRIIHRDSLRQGRPIVADPNRYLNLIQIDDAARVAEAALVSSEVPEIMNVSDDRPGPRVLYYELAASLLGAPSPRFQPPGPNDPARRRGEAHRRVANQRMKDTLNFRLAYPTIDQGLPASLAAEVED